MSLKKIYLTTQIPLWVQAKLSAHLPQFQVLRLSSFNLLEHESENVVALMVRSQTSLNEKLIHHYKDLKIVGTATSGFDHIDFKTLENRAILTFYTPEANVLSTADLTILHLLMSLRNNFAYSISNPKFKWKNQLNLGTEANGRSLGILGLGRIGREVASRALSLGLKVYYHDPYLNVGDVVDSRLEKLGRLELFTHCDAITLHTPLTSETRWIIDRHTLAHFGVDKILINCARGELVNTHDMLEALDQGILQHVGLDTFESEPLNSDSIIRQHPKIFWSPHLGAYTKQAFEKSCLEASDVLIKYFTEGHKPRNSLPPNVPWAKNL